MARCNFEEIQSNERRLKEMEIKEKQKAKIYKPRVFEIIVDTEEEMKEIIEGFKISSSKFTHPDGFNRMYLYFSDL